MDKIVLAWQGWSARLLSVLRIVTSLLFIEHATAKFWAFPVGMGPPGGKPMAPPMFAWPFWYAGVIELVGGVLLLLGLFSRPVAFILSGEMAIAYFTAHYPNGFYPLANRGEAAVFYCFVFLYFSAAGGGPWSLDSLRRRPSAG